MQPLDDLGRRIGKSIEGNPLAMMLAFVLAIVLVIFHDKTRDLHTVCEYAGLPGAATDTPANLPEAVTKICIYVLHRGEILHDDPGR